MRLRLPVRGPAGGAAVVQRELFGLPTCRARRRQSKRLVIFGHACTLEHQLRDEQPEPGATNGDAEMRGTCSAVFYAINGRAALHGAMDMAG